mgnify:CR=1 FL=1
MSIQSNMNPSIYSARKRANFIGMALSMFAMSVGMIFLLWILGILLFKGFFRI